MLQSARDLRNLNKGIGDCSYSFMCISFLIVNFDFTIDFTLPNEFHSFHIQHTHVCSCCALLHHACELIY